ncbi:hypothetical protein V8F33_011236 [Rhypophila sp. PSN 637]
MDFEYFVERRLKQGKEDRVFTPGSLSRGPQRANCQNEFRGGYRCGLAAWFPPRAWATLLRSYEEKIFRRYLIFQHKEKRNSASPDFLVTFAPIRPQLAWLGRLTQQAESSRSCDLGSQRAFPTARRVGTYDLDLTSFSGRTTCTQEVNCWGSSSSTYPQTTLSNDPSLTMKLPSRYLARLVMDMTCSCRGGQPIARVPKLSAGRIYTLISAEVDPLSRILRDEMNIYTHQTYRYYGYSLPTSSRSGRLPRRILKNPADIYPRVQAVFVSRFSSKSHPSPPTQPCSLQTVHT